MEQNSPSGGEGPGPDPLLELLRSIQPGLTPGPAAVAQCVLDDPHGVVPMTVQQLARHSETSDASVIRLAKATGCTGYREFRTRLAAALGAHGASSERSLPADIGLDDGPRDVLGKLVAYETQALQSTAAAMDDQALRSAAMAVVTAKRVVVVGIVASGLVAEDLAAKLNRIGIVAQAFTEGHAAMTQALLLGHGDVMVAISASGETLDVLEPMEAARGAGASTIAITVHHGSSICTADHVLVGVSARRGGIRPAAMSSRTGQLLIVDALFTLVLQQRFEPAKAAISASHKVLARRRRRREQP